MTTNQTRYSSIAIALHWVMAIGFFIMLGSGVLLEYVTLEKSFKFNLYQWHKSGGVLLLMAFTLRVLWRFTHKPPALPNHFPDTEKKLSKLGHLGLYAMMLLMPFSGWLMVSSSSYGLPTIVFGWFQWPHIPGVQNNALLNDLARIAHFYLAIFFGLLIAAHIAAVVKHKVKDNENLLTRIWWSK